MPFHDLTLATLALIVLAASLASFALWRLLSVMRNTRALQWLSLSAGTALFLTAAVFAVLATMFAALSKSLPQTSSLADLATIRWHDSASEAKADTGGDTLDYIASAAIPRRSSVVSPNLDSGDSSDQLSKRQDPHQVQSANATLPVKSDELRLDAQTAHWVQTDLWLASRCVVATGVPLDDGTRWRFENECQLPVAIVVATCDASIALCSSAPRWRYRDNGMILPAKYQRPVTEAEQTVRGSIVRYAACYITGGRLVRLLGADQQERSSTVWQEQFTGLSENDSCVSQVESWSTAGAKSGEWSDLPNWRQATP
jgi:hypothetical protein